MAKFKTGLLIFLVVVSGILAIVLMSVPSVPSPQPKPEDVWFGPEPGLHEVSLPGRVYIINRDADAALVETFSSLYTDLVATMAQIHYNPDMGGGEWAPGEPVSGGFPPGVLFRYDYQISRELLASWMTMFYETGFPFAGIDSIFVPMEQGPVQFINSVTGEVWQLHASLPWTVINRAVSEPENTLGYRWIPMESGENHSVAPGVYQIAQPEVMVVPGWYSEDIYYDALIRSFYLEPALIQEPDGTEIYTDGFQALRIYPTGAVEYTVVSSHSGASLPMQKDLVEKSLEFIAAHGGWPGNMLPTRLGVRPAEKVSMEYSGYGLGVPIFGEGIGLAVEMDGLSINSYGRNIISVRPDAVEAYAEIMPLSKHLSSPTQASEYFSSINGKIVDLALVYYWHKDKLTPAWRVWVERQEIFVGAEDGRVLDIRKQSGGY